MVSDATLRRASAGEVDPDDAPRFVELRSDSDRGHRPVCEGYIPHKKQAVGHYLADLPDTDVIVVNAGRRSGKSEWKSAQHSTRYIRDLWDKRWGRGRWSWRGPARRWRAVGKSPEPFLHYALIAPTYSLLTPLKRKFQRMLGMADAGGWIVHQTNQTWWLLHGIQMDWRSGDNPERLVADNYDGVGLDEFARMKADVWEEHLQPALADSGAWATITSTPLGKASAMWRLWSLGDPAAAQEIAESTGEDPRLDPRVRCVSWTSMDNTANPRIAEFAERMRHRMPAALWRRSFLASWVAFVGQIFELEGDRLRRRSGEAEFLRSIASIAAGMDFGFTEPGVLSVWGSDHDSRPHELRSHIARRLAGDTDQAWAARANRDRTSWSAVAYALLDEMARALPHLGYSWNTIPLYVPHDNPGLRRDLRQRGFRVQKGYTDPGSRVDGLSWFLSQAMDPAGLSFATPAVLQSFQSLVYPDGKTGADAEVWDKTRSNDHAFDAGRMANSERIKRWDMTPRAALNWLHL